MQKLIKMAATTLLICFTSLTFGLHAEEMDVPRVRVIEPTTIERPIELVSASMTEIEPDPEPEEQIDDDLLSQEEIELIALVTMGEAEGESEQGKRMVISTILNRVDHEKFPDTVREVIYQPNQFSCMSDGRIDRCYVREDICQLVREEMENRTNHDVIFFSADHYSNYGSPMFAVGNHYFSSYF